jgi:signal transduction histidine kinase
LAFSVVGKPLRIYNYSDDLSVKELKRIDIPHTILMTSEDSVANLLWVATEKGVYKLDNKNFAILGHYTKAEGMANDFVYAAIPDKFGWVWCSTNKGIVAINGVSGDIRNFDKDTNLQSLEFNNRAFAADKDGYIYFGGVKGLNYFKPPFISKDTIQPRLVIEEILLNNQAYRSDMNPDLVKTVAFDYSPVPLAFKVLALHLVKSGGLKIVYRLNGQEQWTEIENGGSISMFNLAPGNYIMELGFREHNRTASNLIRQVRIKVHPPFYNTWWFIMGLTILIMVVVGYSVKWNQKRKMEKLQKENEIIKLKAEQQLAISKERERITADLHDDVGATLSSLNIYGDLAHSIWETNPEKSKEMVGKIALQSRELMQRMSDIIWSMKEGINGTGGFTPRIRNFAQELLSGKNIVVQLDMDEALLATITNPMVRKNILLIIKEALNNAAKYSGAKEISIAILKVQDELTMKISDDGKGFDVNIVRKGNGLENMATRCKQMGGSFDLLSQPGTGTTILCTVPLAIISYPSNQ